MSRTEQRCQDGQHHDGQQRLQQGNCVTAEDGSYQDGLPEDGRDKTHEGPR